MMEGPLLEGKFWTEPSIVDTDESEGEGEVDEGPKSGSGSDSHVSRQNSRRANRDTALYCTVLPLLLSTSHIYFLPDLNTRHELDYLTIIIHIPYFLMPPPGAPPVDGYPRQRCNPSRT